MPWVELTMALVLTSSAFVEGGTIPAKFTCDGPDRSPALAWSGAPANTQAFALIADDLDAPVGTWVHWVLFNLPATTSALPENVAKVDSLKDLGNALQGRNDFKKLGYGGPCPPPGKPHRYFFKLYALDKTLDLKEGATKDEVVKAMNDHIVAQGQLMGKFSAK